MSAIVSTPVGKKDNFWLTDKTRFLESDSFLFAPHPGVNELG
jgi:hypothetical protein